MKYCIFKIFSKNYNWSLRDQLQSITVIRLLIKIANNLVQNERNKHVEGIDTKEKFEVEQITTHFVFTKLQVVHIFTKGVMNTVFFFFGGGGVVVIL